MVENRILSLAWPSLRLDQWMRARWKRLDLLYLMILISTRFGPKMPENARKCPKTWPFGFYVTSLWPMGGYEILLVFWIAYDLLYNLNHNQDDPASDARKTRKFWKNFFFLKFLNFSLTRPLRGSVEGSNWPSSQDLFNGVTFSVVWVDIRLKIWLKFKKSKNRFLHANFLFKNLSSHSTGKGPRTRT